jgi:hypothetical protein
MEKVMPSFEYEPLILSPKPKTSNEEENRGDTDGVTPSSIGVSKEIGYFRGGNDNIKRKDFE